MTKRIVSFICVVTMLMSICALSSFALTIDESVDTNWNAFAIKFSERTKLPIYTNVGGEKVLKSEGFEFLETDNCGIDINMPSYEEFMGVYSTAVLTSEHTTALEDLTVDINLDDFKFQMDPYYQFNGIGILWSEDPISDISRLSNSDTTADNGIRHLIPVADTVEGFKEGVSAENAEPQAITGKALYIGINNSNLENEGTKTASDVTIVYYDGHYVNATDSAPGYKWEFTARNHNGPDYDASLIRQRYEALDLSYGLKITFKPDEEHGFIVNINGNDYYEGEKIAYFPEADKGQGNSHKELTDKDYFNDIEAYLNSMTYAKEDIDLTGLTAAEKGYLTVGVIGNKDRHYINQVSDIIVEKVNNIPAAEWKGEPACNHENKEWVVTQEANCGVEGEESYLCTDCGKVFETKAAPTVGEHIPEADWTVVTRPDCTNEGKQLKYCTVCGLAVEEDAIPVEANSHNYAWKIIAPTCTEDGTKTAKCENCGTTDTIVDEGSAKGHIPGEWVITKEATVQTEGEKTKYCIVCITELEKEIIPKLDVVVNFIDVDPSAWYAEGVNYCALKGYIAGIGNYKFNPDGKLTREQFVVILARVSKADLSKYKTTSFTDVDVFSWYGASVIWANESGYVNGIGNGRFGVGQNIDRESLATLFYRYAEKQGIDVSKKADMSGYSDLSEISSWSTDACAWAVNAGLLTSTNTDVLTLSPKMTVTRAQAAKIFMSYDNIQ